MVRDSSQATLMFLTTGWVGVPNKFVPLCRKNQMMILDCFEPYGDERQHGGRQIAK